MKGGCERVCTCSKKCTQFALVGLTKLNCTHMVINASMKRVYRNRLRSQLSKCVSELVSRWIPDPPGQMSACEWAHEWTSSRSRRRRRRETHPIPQAYERKELHV